MPLFQGTQQGYYSQTQGFTGLGAGNLTYGPVTTAFFPTRPTQQSEIRVFINEIEVSKNSYSYNGTDPGDTTVDDSYNIVFNNNNPNTDIQAADGSPLANLPILFQEILPTEEYGDYQYISLEDIINNFIISYVGEDKIISKIRRTDVAFHAQRGLAELSYDTLKSFKSQEIEVPPSLTMKLPHDYVNYVKICYIDADGVESLDRISDYLGGAMETGNAQVDKDGKALGNVVPNKLGDRLQKTMKRKKAAIAKQKSSMTNLRGYTPDVQKVTQVKEDVKKDMDNMKKLWSYTEKTQ